MSISPEYKKIVIDALCSTLLNDANTQIRAKAAESLGKIGYEEAIPALCNAWLLDNDINVRFEAADALVMIINVRSIKTMPETPKYDLHGANIGNLADSVQGNQIAFPTIDVSGQEKSLAEAAIEIQDLLSQMQASYPTTDYEKQVFVNKFNEVIPKGRKTASLS